MKCERCGGSGEIWYRIERADMDYPDECPDCEGTGEISNTEVK